MLDANLIRRYGKQTGTAFAGIVAGPNKVMRRVARRDLVTWDADAHGYRMDAADAQIVLQRWPVPNRGASSPHEQANGCTGICNAERWGEYTAPVRQIAPSHRPTAGKVAAVNDNRHSGEAPEPSPDLEARRALVFHDRPLVVDLISLTLNHGMFLVRAARDVPRRNGWLRCGDPTWRSSTWNATTRSRPCACSARRVLSSRARCRSSASPAATTSQPSCGHSSLVLTTSFHAVLAQELLARSIVIVRRSRRRIGRSCQPSARPTLKSMYWRAKSGSGQTSRRTERHRTEPALRPCWQRRSGRHPRLDPGCRLGTKFAAESNIVDSHIRALRNKLGDDYRHPRFIATVPGPGLPVRIEILGRRVAEAGRFAGVVGPLLGDMTELMTPRKGPPMLRLLVGKTLPWLAGR